MSKSEFIVDLETIRNNARQHLEKGAVTENYASDRKAVIKMLNGALAVFFKIVDTFFLTQPLARRR